MTILEARQVVRQSGSIFTGNLRTVEQAELEEGLFRLQLLYKPADIIVALEALLPIYQVAREKYGQSA